MALNIDLAPTIVAAARASAPDVMQGSDLAPLYLRDRPPLAWRDEFLYEHPTIISKHRIPSSRALVRLDYKYVLWPEWDLEQLFDLETDPGELNDLANDPASVAVRDYFRQRLQDWLIETR